MATKPMAAGRLTFLRLTPALLDQLRAGDLTAGRNVYERTFRRILYAVRGNEDAPVAIIGERELLRLRDFAKADVAEGWQEWAREALEHNGL